MKRKLFFAAMLLAGASSFNAHAQITDGTYYLYNEETGKFLGGGSDWGTRAISSDFGTPFTISKDGDAYTLQRYVTSEEGHLGNNLFIDATANIKWQITGTASECAIQNVADSKYLAISADEVTLSDDNTCVWALKSATEQQTIVAEKLEKNILSAATAADISVTSVEAFKAELEKNYKEANFTFLIKSPNAGNKTDWKFTAGRTNYPAPTYNVGLYGAELYQSSGTVTQTVAVPHEGLYKVSLNAFYRPRTSDKSIGFGDAGFVMSDAFVSVNNEYYAQIPDWYGQRDIETKTPNNTNSAAIAFNNGQYGMEVYAYVGEDKQLTITLNVPQYTGYADENNKRGEGWCLFGNWKLTYFGQQVDYSHLADAILTAQKLDATTLKRINYSTEALQAAITAAQECLTAISQDEVDQAAEELTTIFERLKLAGTAQKAAALKSFIDEDIDNEIADAKAYALDAAATAEGAIEKTAALNAHFATWEEVKLVNAGFDEKINRMTNGAETGVLLDYTAKDKTTNQTKEFIYGVEGWNGAFKFESSASQGTTTAYGAPAKEKGQNSTAAPAVDMYGESEGGVLHLSSGWNDIARYQQTVELLAGKYVFYYEGFNANNTQNELVANYCGVESFSSPEKAFPYNEWKAAAFSFTQETDKKDAMVSVGITGGTGGSGTTPKMWFDNVKIYRIGNCEVTLDETSEEEPVAYQQVDVTVKRKLKAGHWNTLCVPFDMDVPAEWDVRQLSESTKNGEHISLTFTTAESIKAGVPYIVKPTDARETFSVQGVAIKPELNTTTSVADVDFVGNYVSGTVPVGSYFISNSAFYYADIEGAPLKGFRAIVTPKTSGVQSVKIFVDGEAVSIDGIHTDMEDGAWYTVQGMKVNQPTKGIYIHNGKKVFIQ